MLRAPLTFLLAVFGFFGGWTVASNAVTLFGLPFGFLLAALVFGLAGAAGALALRGSAMALVTAPELALRPIVWGRTLSVIRRRWPILLGVAAAILAGGAWFVKTSDFRPLWAIAIVAAAVCVWLSPRAVATAGEGDRPPPSQEKRPRLSFALLAVATLGAYFFTSVPDGDDSFYLNLSIAMKHAEGGVLLADTTLGDPGWPLLGSNYRAESLPTLTAAVSAATGIPVIVVAHAIIPALWCLAFACAGYVVSYSLFRERWALCAFTLLLVLFGLGWSYQSYGRHGLIRLFHGKGLFVAVLAPLIFHLTFAALKKNSATGAVLVFGLCVCALGATANAIYLGPLCAGLVCAAFFFDPEERNRFRSVTFLWIAVYSLLVGGYLVAFDLPVKMQVFDDTIGGAVWSLFSSKGLIAVLLLTLAAAAMAPALDSRWRFAGLYLGAVLAFAFNPVLWPVYSEFLTGKLSFRLAYAVPFALIVAVGGTLAAISAPRFGAPALAATALLFALSPNSILRHATLGFAPIKVDRPARAAAGAAVDATPEGGRILAAAPVALWVPTFERRRRLVAARADYLEQQRPAAPAGEVDRRLELQRWIDGDAPIAAARLADLLSAYCVTTVVRNPRDEAAARIAQDLRDLGAAPMGEAGGYSVSTFKRTCSAGADSRSPATSAR